MNDAETTVERPADWIEPTVSPDAEIEPDDDDAPAHRDDDEPDDDEPDDEPVPEPAPPDDRAMEQAYGKIERKRDNYVKAQRALLDTTGLPWDDCPACGGLAFVLPWNADDPDDQERRAVVEAYFNAGEPPYLPDPQRTRCERCDGWGRNDTGSRDPLHRFELCTACIGNGWVLDSRAPVVTANGDAGAVPPPPPQYGAGATQTEPDFWGRPPGHRDYGVPPSMVNG